jgi:hypothetical protein
MNTEEGQSRKVIAVAKLKSCWMMKYVGGVKVGYKSRARLCKISEWTGQNMRNSYCDFGDFGLVSLLLFPLLGFLM